MASVFRRKTGGWTVQWTERGKRRSRDFASKTDAKELEYQISQGMLIADAEKQARSITFEQFAEIYMRDHCRVHKAESQWRTDALNIKLHLEPEFSKLRLDELRKAHFIGLTAALRAKQSGRKRPLSPKSINLILGLAKKMLAVAVDMDYLAVNPFHHAKILTLPERRPDYWTPPQRDAFIVWTAEVDPEFSRIVTVACHTGLRLGELAALQFGDVDLFRRMLRVTKSLDVNTGRVGPTKNKDIQDVPLNKAALKALEHTATGPRSSLVFETRLLWSASKRLDRLAADYNRQAQETDRLPAIRFHDLRHTFASCLAMAGVDLLLIQKLCRHKSYAMTLRYAHLHPSHFKGATDVLCSMNAAKTDRLEKSGGPRGT